MSLIEGVGDEVVQFLGALVVFAVAAVAWWSTNARPDRYRTVLVMRSRPHHPVTVSIRTRPETATANSQTSIPAIMDTVDGAAVSEPSESSHQSRVIPLQEMDSIIDADMAMLDNNRLHFYRRMDSPSPENASQSSAVEEGEPQDNVEPASTAQIREMDSIVNAMEADVTTGCDFFARNQGCNSTSVSTSTESAVSKIENKKTENTSATTDNITTVNAESLDTHTATKVSVLGEKRILIKLKYLNDTLKEVDGSLDEQLKDFKWRHFSAELTSECRVRLIFNGRVLIDDGATLRACGLHDRAVVHCLVHPNRAAGQQRSIPEEGNINTTEIIGETTPVAERTWDLENILMTLVSVALTVVWFFRCEYSNMFTASASVALFGLTMFYSVAIFGLYLSDTFHFDRRPDRPIPAN